MDRMGYNCYRGQPMLSDRSKKKASSGRDICSMRAFARRAAQLGEVPMWGKTNSWEPKSAINWMVLIGKDHYFSMDLLMIYR